MKNTKHKKKVKKTVNYNYMYMQLNFFPTYNKLFKNPFSNNQSWKTLIGET